MGITNRSYQHPHDFARLAHFLSLLRPDALHTYVLHPGDLTWQMFHMLAEYPPASLVQLWDCLLYTSWLHNIPNYRALFPPCVLEHFVYQEHKFLGVWGQFVRWNGAAHEERYQQFLSDLGYAHTVIEAIRAIPLPVTGAVVPLQAFYTWYGIS